MDIELPTILWGLLFGSIGFGYFLYGKKQKKPIALVTGLILMGFPYLVTDTLALVGIGGLIMVVPFVWKG